MPAFGHAFSDAEIRALIVFIKETAKRSVSPEMKGSHAIPQGVSHSEAQDFRMETVCEGFDVPWSMAFLPDGKMLVAERPGRLRVVENGVLDPTPIADIPKVWAHDEGGLFSVVLHPDYEQNGWIYLSFADPGENNTSMTKIVRGRLRDHRYVDQETIFSMPLETYRESGMSFGGRLVFAGPYLYFSIGERNLTGEAQNLSNPLGKIHRVFDDGTIPEDNPFVLRPEAFKSIWTYGNRNPQGLAYNSQTGEIWETEHGPRGGDELNFLQISRNYGWPLATHGMNYDGTPISPHTSRPGMEPPVEHWTPSIAVCPVMFYSGNKLPGWKGHLFLGSLAQQEFRRFVVNRGAVEHEELVFKNLGRVRDIQTGPDELIYISLEVPGGGGKIVRLSPAEAAETATH
jgi:aldose sugar dehydrogenase